MKRMLKIILLLPSGREYDRGLMRGIAEYAQIHGPWIFYKEPPAYLCADGTKRRLAHMRAWKADGLFIPQSRAQEVRSLRLPTVTLCGTRHLPDQKPQLRSDNEAIGRMAAEHFRGQGFQRLAYCGLSGMDWSEERKASFLKNAALTGIRTDVYRSSTSRSSESWYTEEAHLGEWLEALPKPVGLLACNDDRARMVAEVCRIRNIRVPDEIAVLGVDNDEHVCKLATPALSSISLATEQAGYDAARLLDALIAGRSPRAHVVLAHPVGIIPRQSTDLIACKDPNLVKAVRFIRANCNTLTQVSDVAQASGLSRRVLQDRFLQGLGCTILEAIQQSRIRHIQRLLAETNLSIADIAEASGYPNDAHLARFFSRRTGITPSAYRRMHRKA